MKTIEELQELIGKKIDGFCRKNGDGSIYQPINYIVQLGGKRMRPVLSLMAANLYSDDIDDAIYPALAMEIFHNFTLMHDDIMDNAPLRRGKPTVHEKWNRDVAILSGDAMMIQSYQLLMKTRPEILSDILKIYNQTALEVCEGQQSDMDFQCRNDVSIDEYMEMIRLKTSVLLGGSMQIGALIGGADEEGQKLIYDFAVKIGLSFQLWDDYLDAFGNDYETGKQIGGDIQADKKTFLMLRSFEKAGAEELAVLNKYLGQFDKGSEKVNAVLSVYRQLQVDNELKELVDQLHAEGLELLEKVPVDHDRKKMLRNFALSLKGRKS